jgi:hypothetical protein
MSRRLKKLKSMQERRQKHLERLYSSSEKPVVKIEESTTNPVKNPVSRDNYHDSISGLIKKDLLKTLLIIGFLTIFQFVIFYFKNTPTKLF